ncbi:hypothetical protein C8R44DRAFT_639620, partial [Mycena epipterygia]
MSTSGNASLDLPVTKLPLLHEGETMQSQLRQLEVHCQNYFSLKDIAADKQVANLIGCFRDYRITTWLENDTERAAAILLTFKAFMVEVRERLLPTDWERSVKQEMMSRKQAKNETFLTFITAVERFNSLLINTPSHLDTAHVRTLLESNMLTDLADDLNDEGKAADETNYKKWADIFKRKDNTRIRNLNRLNEIADECAKRDRRTTAPVDERPPKRSKTNENAPPSTSGASSSSTSNADGGKRCPKLTEDERGLLAANYGCTRCRLPFVGHGDAQDKTCPWPAPTNYKPVTQATIDAATATLTPDLRVKYGVKPKPAPIAVIAPVELDDVDDSDDSVDSAASGVSEPHLYWDFRMEGPMSNLPIDVRGLIDNGAHLVLIRKDLVQRLALRRSRLHKPVPISVALETNNAPSTAMLYEYIHFKALSNDLSYETKTVRALIAPNLCAPVILGLPFLTHNSIVVDHGDRNVIDKKSNYNLLDPVIASPPPPPRPKLREHSNLFESVRDVDVVAAVHERIEALAELEHREKLGISIKAEYQPIFEPIPHVDDLPTDVLCEIKIKDAYKTLSKRSYQSPRKYKDAWQ